MAQPFSLSAQVCGNQHTVSAEPSARGYTVQSSLGPRYGVGRGEALRLACHEMASVLEPARRPGVPWGLHVSVGDRAAVYGEWPLLRGPVDPGRQRETRLSRIRRRWRDGDGPMAALDNARQIIETYAAARRAA
jgi:hypothetical protein